ncbi:uncharacterized protein EV420DRAFT_1103537 [Desarmillaria tabescens]|uniref:Uncharacterized protein n=1 Tax=Armillaria tabescens TaxID=1929756 RepID=A0AA39TZA1_ARMTA|nr:uncharacterized protein EV420DRAFT_1103537 [Desarmillaria tabescens]KAK0463695.1 hypothetical protein EV420DRAFT_1103537 [Desarmillaria tabescens]
MALIRLRKFFYYFSLRMGISVLSFFKMVGGTVIAAAGWLQVAQLDAHPLAVFDTFALYFHTVVFSLLALVGLFGLISATMKKRNPVQVYGIFVAIILAVSVASGVVVLYSLFRAKDAQTIKRCMHGATDRLTENVCQNGIAIFKATGVAIYVVSWAILAYSYLIAASYAAHPRQDAEDQETQSPVTLKGKAISGPEPLVTYNSVGAPGYNQGYAFSRVHEPKDIGQAV